MCILKVERAERNRGIRRQRGLSLIETAAVLGVASLALGAFVNIMVDNTEQLKAKSVAEKMLEVQKAANDYVKAKNADLLEATRTTPIVIPVGREGMDADIPKGPSSNLPSLQGGGFLSPAFIDKNGYSQRHAVIVKQTVLPSGERRLDTVVTTYGGNTVPDRQLQRIAGFIGASGGYVPHKPLPGESDDVVVGVQGGWRAPVEAWGAPGRRPEQGAVVATMAYEVGTTLTDYLYRTDIGIPEANKMRTDLTMANKPDGKESLIKGDAGKDAFGRASTDVVGINSDLKAGGTVTAGIDIWAKETVRGQKFVDTNADGTTSLDANGNAYEVDPSNTSNINNLKTVKLDLDTIVYGASRGLSESQGIRLGDLLPKLVTHGKTFKTPSDRTVRKPTCGPQGVPRIALAPREDSQRFDVKLDYTWDDAVSNGKVPSSPGYPHSPPPGGYEYGGILDNGLILEKKRYLTGVDSNGRKTEIARQYTVANAATYWTVGIDGTGNATDYDWVLEVTTYCEYP